MKERTQNPRIPDHPLGWMRYALGTLLVIFVLGAGWGVTAWLSVSGDSPETFYLTDETADPSEDIAETGEGELTSVQNDPGLEVATSEPTDDYPLDVFDQAWEEIDPLAVSQAISASLEQEFMSLESSGIQVAENLPPREEASTPAAVVVDSPEPPALERTTSAESVVVEAESPLEALEDFSLPDFETDPVASLEEVVNVEAEPLDAQALDVPEALLHQTVTTGVVSIPPPTAERQPSLADSSKVPFTATQEPLRQTSSSARSPKSGSRDRLLKAMSRLEKSLK